MIRKRSSTEDPSASNYLTQNVPMSMSFSWITFSPSFWAWCAGQQFGLRGLQDKFMRTIAAAHSSMPSPCSGPVFSALLPSLWSLQKFDNKETLDYFVKSQISMASQRSNSSLKDPDTPRRTQLMLWNLTKNHLCAQFEANWVMAWHPFYGNTVQGAYVGFSQWRFIVARILRATLLK